MKLYDVSLEVDPCSPDGATAFITSLRDRLILETLQIAECDCLSAFAEEMHRQKMARPFLSIDEDELKMKRRFYAARLRELTSAAWLECMAKFYAEATAQNIEAPASGDGKIVSIFTRDHNA